MPCVSYKIQNFENFQKTGFNTGFTQVTGFNTPTWCSSTRDFLLLLHRFFFVVAVLKKTVRNSAKSVVICWVPFWFYLHLDSYENRFKGKETCAVPVIIFPDRTRVSLPKTSIFVRFDGKQLQTMPVKNVTDVVPIWVPVSSVTVK